MNILKFICKVLVNVQLYTSHLHFQRLSVGVISVLFLGVMNTYPQTTFPPTDATSYTVEEITSQLVRLQSISSANEIFKSFNALPTNYYILGKIHKEKPLHRMIFIQKEYRMRVISKNPLSIGGRIETITLFYNSEDTPIMRIGINIICHNKEDRDKLAKAFIATFDFMGYDMSDYDKAHHRGVGKTTDMLNAAIIRKPKGFDGHWELYISLGEYTPYVFEE